MTGYPLKAVFSIGLLLWLINSLVASTQVCTSPCRTVILLEESKINKLIQIPINVESSANLTGKEIIDFDTFYIGSTNLFNSVKRVKNILYDSSVDILLVDEDVPGQQLLLASDGSWASFCSCLVGATSSSRLDLAVRCHTCSPGNAVAPPAHKQRDPVSRLVNVFLEILVRLKWTKLCIIYQGITERYAGRLSSSLADTGVIQVLYDLDSMTSDEVQGLLQSTYQQRETLGLNFYLLCNEAGLYQVLDQISRLGAVNQPASEMLHLSKWVVIILNTRRQIRPLIQRLAKNVNHLVYVDMEYDEPQGSHDVKVAKSEICHGSDIWLLTLLWKVGRRELSPVGCWTGFSTLALHDDIFPNEKFGFNGKTFVVTTNMWPPFVMKKEKTGDTEYFGFCVNLLKDLANSLNFSYILTEPQDGEWGVKKNGSWTGMIGQLARREVNLMVSPTTILIERENVMDFTIPFYYDYTVILLKKPDPSEQKWRALIDIFQWQVLAGIGSAVVITSVVFYLLERYNPYYDRVPYHVHMGLFTAFWYTFSTLVSQSRTRLPDSLTGRTVTSFWSLFTLLTAAAFSGQLIASLTVSIDKPPFSSLEEMIAQTSYKWGILGTSANVKQFQNSKNRVYKTIWDGLQTFFASDQQTLSTSHNVHLEKVLRGGYAFLVDKTSAEIISATHCDLYMSKENFFPQIFGLGLPNNSAYTQIFSNQVQLMRENGVYHLWGRRWWPSNAACLQQRTETKGVTLLDVQGVFYLLAIGIVTAGTSLILEIVSKPSRSFEGSLGRK